MTFVTYDVLVVTRADWYTQPMDASGWKTYKDDDGTDAYHAHSLGNGYYRVLRAWLPTDGDPFDQEYTVRTDGRLAELVEVGASLPGPVILARIRVAARRKHRELARGTRD